MSDRGALSIRVGEGGLSGYNTENLTVDHSVIIIISGKRVLRVARFLHAKDIVCRFRNRVGALWPL